MDMNTQYVPAQTELPGLLLRQMKKQLAWTRVCAIVCAAMLVLSIAVIVVVGAVTIQVSVQLNKYAGDVENLNVMIDKMDAIADDLGDISTQLVGIDWVDMSENINDMALTAEESLQQAMSAVDELDIETLNTAIRELQTVLEPLAAFVNNFR